ncbi:MAG TPA: Rne/Rng family ribonuclease [Pseudonocardiaceae bacterium]|jgi:ribonuclease E|nr:Rne/Rng family ribonuclease [Pseudonocardiaceae bacterium]
MPNTKQPATNAGGNPGAPTHPALAGLPDKVRVHALGKLLDRSSREILDVLTGLGEAARSAQSSLDRDLAIRVAELLLADDAPVAEHEPEPEPEPAPDVEPVMATALTPVFAAPAPVFLPPTTPAAAPAKPARAKQRQPEPVPVDDEDEVADEAATTDEGTEPAVDAEDEDSANRRRRRRGRRGRGRGKGTHEDGTSDDDADGDETDQSDTDTADAEDTESDEQDEAATDDGDGDGGGTRRRRRRRRRKGTGDSDADANDDPPNTVVHVRESRDEKPDRHETSTGNGHDEVRSVRGSTRLEAKRQRRRDGREAGRRRVPILSESEFLARREAVDRKMVVNQRGDSVQIGVLEDGVLVEHFVTSAGSGSLVGNVYLGRVQNVLPSMEAAFVDIGRGRNAVLYAGEVDWDAAGLEGKARKIEQALSTGDSVLVQVTKDPVGHKGARLTTQISLPGRFLVYVPGGGATGISRKLPDTERKRLKDVLKRVVPEDAGVIIRTASEGVSEEELGRDVRRLRAQWDVIGEKASAPNAKSPQLLYEEPDLLIKVIRDLFTEDFSALTVQGHDAWDTIEAYVSHVAPDLVDRLRRHVGTTDVFTEFRIDEQILKALDRKVWLPSGGYLVIDRTEAMTVIDVNTGKFTGSGGNLEETVTRNNLEAAEEIVRQLRLRDIGGIIVVDFIDMVLESNRDLVLRRLTECLGRDRTRHQVAEVTSLGLVQMTRKRVGTGLLEAFSTTCEHCRGRGVLVSTTPVHMHASAPATPAATASTPPPPPPPAAVAVPERNGTPNGNGGGNTNGNNSSNSSGNSGQQQSGGGSRRTRHRNQHHDHDKTTVAANPEPEATAPSVSSTPVEHVAAPVETSPVETSQVEASPVETSPVAAPSTNGHQPLAEPVAVHQTPAVAVANPPRPTRRRAASRPAGPPAAGDGQQGEQTPV